MDKVRMIQDEYTRVELDPKTKALLDFARKVTLSPKEMVREDVATLRKHGYSDRDILDAAQLVGYFNFSNRVMDSLGIDPEPWMRYRTGGGGK